MVHRFCPGIARTPNDAKIQKNSETARKPLKRPAPLIYFQDTKKKKKKLDILPTKYIFQSVKNDRLKPTIIQLFFKKYSSSCTKHDSLRLGMNTGSRHSKLFQHSHCPTIRAEKRTPKKKKKKSDSTFSKVAISTYHI